MAFLIGTAGNDILIGGGADDVLLGFDGTDRLEGGPGSDLLDGGPDPDALLGGDGDDFYVFGEGDTIADTGGNDTVISGDPAVSFILAGAPNLENVLLQGGEAIDVTGNAASNRIIGNAASNLIVGDAGDDTIGGGGGARDTFIGGPGADTFLFQSLLDTNLATPDNIFAGPDNIVDFTSGTDKIDVSGIDANVGTPADDPFTFVGLLGAAALPAAGQIGFRSLPSATVILFDNDGIVGADGVIELTGAITLVGTDFVL